MSSEEVAELAQAIHSHADALYESWTKGPEAIRRMTRMEDTLELLADPGLTPKLEHLVSTFVRRDKAKRQGNGTIIVNNNTISRHQTSPPPSKEDSVSGTVVTNIPITVQQQVNGANKKPLPKSILAVVQRFEPSSSSSSSSSTSSSSPLVSVPVVNNNSVLNSSAVSTVFPALPSDPLRIAGVGNVSRNVLWAESNSRHTVTEKSLRHVHPNSSPPESPLSRSRSPTLSPTRKVRERHIPIERCDDEPSSPRDSTSTRVLNVNKVETTQNVLVNNLTGLGGKRGDIKELEREEERLFQALRTGQIIPTTLSPNFEALRERAFAPLSSSPRIAFAKERIRQSQEHPLTQQRLELQKRLPSPSSSLAAAIAVQQGKIKFQPGFDEEHVPSPTITVRENGIGRHSWVSSLRFNNGASVADRVQLFEKYPSHMVSPPPSPPLLSNSVSLSSPSHPAVMSNGSSNVSIVNVSMAPKDEGVRKQTKSSVTQSAPWRGIPIEPYQPDILGSSAKKQKQTGKPGSPAVVNSRSVYPPVPRFYWPEGKRPPAEFIQDAVSKARDALTKYPPYLSYLHMGQMLTVLGIPLYWKKSIWNFLGLKNEELLDSERFLHFYQRLMSDCPDDETRFLCIMSVTARKKYLSSPHKRASISEEFSFSDVHRMHICMSDFIPMMQDIIDTHPGLGFLRDAPEFHSRYITTVISRIFYKVNRSWSGKITLQELRRSNLMRIIKRLEEETDVNTITEYFSYEHFYVIYCKFWELDKDHDLLIDKKDLQAHGELALSTRIIDRIFEGTVIRGWDVASPVKFTPGKMTYSDFVWFLLSEEDKKTQTAIEYWFRCLDIDGDGVLSPYELQYFYQEQENRIESLGIEPLDFANIYCQMVDMLRCSPTGIRLTDLKRNPQLAATCFNTLFNLDKYLDHEQRDPFAASAASGSGHEAQEGESDWDKYAAAEYENLIAEESPSDHLHENSDFEDSGVGIYSSPQ
ncbi:unnamed protein product [Allacma fusca]|nr:unnamed protein product [Allacma fusca]